MGSTHPDDPMAQLAAVLLALFGQMERTYTLEGAARVRSVATAKGRRIGRPSVVDPGKLAYATHLCESGHTMAEIVARTEVTRTTLDRHLLSRPPESVRAGPITAAEPAPGPGADSHPSPVLVMCH